MLTRYAHVVIVSDNCLPTCAISRLTKNASQNTLGPACDEGKFGRKVKERVPDEAFGMKKWPKKTFQTKADRYVWMNEKMSSELRESFPRRSRRPKTPNQALLLASLRWAEAICQYMLYGMRSRKIGVVNEPDHPKEIRLVTLSDHIFIGIVIRAARYDLLLEGLILSYTQARSTQGFLSDSCRQNIKPYVHWCCIAMCVTMFKSKLNLSYFGVCLIIL
jgi:hypothetical protein